MFWWTMALAQTLPQGACADAWARSGRGETACVPLEYELPSKPSDDLLATIPEVWVRVTVSEGAASMGVGVSWKLRRRVDVPPLRRPHDRPGLRRRPAGAEIAGGPLLDRVLARLRDEERDAELDVLTRGGVSGMRGASPVPVEAQ